MVQCVREGKVLHTAFSGPHCGIGRGIPGVMSTYHHLSLGAQQLELGTSYWSPKGGWLVRMLAHLVVLVLAGLMYVNTPSLPSSR